jgi:CheY-like chemotaxis protein
VIFALIQEARFMEMIERAAEREGQKCLVLDGEEAFDAAFQEATPQVLLLDITIPTLDGPSFVEKLKQKQATRDIPLVVFGTGRRSGASQVGFSGTIA